MTTLYSQQRQALEGTIERGPLDVSTVIIDISALTTATPTALTVRLFRDAEDISAGNLQGTAQIDGLLLVSPQVINIELGRAYNLLYTFEVSGQTITRVVQLFGQYRRIYGEPFYVGQYEKRAVWVDAAKWGATTAAPPEAAVCSLWRKHTNVSAGLLQSYSAGLSGAACVISGTDLFTDNLQGLTPGYDYDLRVVFELDRGYHEANDVCVAMGRVMGDV